MTKKPMYFWLKTLSDVPQTIRNCQCSEYYICLTTTTNKDCGLDCSECVTKYTTNVKWSGC